MEMNGYELSSYNGEESRMVSQLTRKLQTIRDYYKEKGFLGLFRYICSHLIVYNNMTIFEADLSRPFEYVNAKIPVKIRLLSTDERDIEQIIKLWPDFYNPPRNIPLSMKEYIINRLSLGEECMIAEYEGKIIHMNWIGFQNTHLFNPPYIRKKGIGADEALSYNTFCDGEYRGNHLMGAVFSEMFNFLKRKGYKRLIGFVVTNNYPSMKVVSALFGKPVQTLRTLSILGFSLYFLSRRR